MAHMKKSLLILLLTALAGCANNLGSLDFPGVYKISITQGNVILQTMVDQLRPGMTKNQVIFVMAPRSFATPLIRTAGTTSTTFSPAAVRAPRNASRSFLSMISSRPSPATSCRIHPKTSTEAQAPF